MNRAKLIAWAKSQGATAADCASVETLTKWFEANGYDPAKVSDGKDTKSLSTIWATTPTIKLAADPDPEDDPETKQAKADRDAQKADFQAKRAGGGDTRVQTADKDADDKAKKGGLSWSPAADRRSWERKQYNQKRLHVGKGISKPLYFDDADQAEVSGALHRVSAMGEHGYSQRAMDLDILKSAGIDIKANIGTTMTSGGVLIPEQFDPTLIDTKEVFGVWEQLVGVTPMMNDTWRGPRYVTDFTVYAPGEGASITESNMAFDQVSITAVQMWVLTTLSLELLNDSAINFIALAASKMKYAFDAKMDDILINGDGTSTYFGQTGFRSKLLNLSATRANIAGLVVADGNAWSEITLPNLEAVQGQLPARWDGASPQWLCHKRFQSNVVGKLAKAAGGVTATEIVNGISRKTFDGDPIFVSQKMPRVEANDVVCALYGSFKDAAKVGVVNNSRSIAQSDQRYFELGVLGIRGGLRAGVTVHSPGNASATEASREPGPVVGLLTAAS